MSSTMNAEIGNPQPKTGDPILSEDPVLPQTPESEESAEPWCVYSQKQKLIIIGLASVAGFFSPLSSSIYFPAIQNLADEYHKSISQINLTVTVFMIFQGLVPALFTDLAENVGKRPVYLITFTLYLAANIGLALQDSYGALMGLRCLQSSGSSVTAALAISSAGDVAKGSERGRYVGATTAGLLVGPAVGPVIGGLLAGSLGWRAIFWFLAICSGVFIIVYFLFGRESAREIVGNGSILPPKLNQSMWQLFTHRNDEPNINAKTRRTKWRIPNPTRSFIMFTEKDLFCILVFSSLLMAAVYQLAASTVVIFQDTYGYNDTIIGLCYIPYGVGSMLGSMGGGKFLDIILKRFAAKYDFDVDKRNNREQDLKFPWARTRLAVTVPCSLIAAVMLLCYGWVVEARTSVAAPLVFQFFFSFFAITASTSIGVMLVDCYPTRSATASAANNIGRCLVGAGATAVIQPMLDAMGRGWCFTFVSLVLILFLLLLLPVWIKGVRWRMERILREEASLE